MSKPVDKTVVQRGADATLLQNNALPPDHTVVEGAPGMDVKPAQLTARTATEGMVLKQRFELVERLGAGGMGAVFKARDLRQVEAGDSDPWVAVKVINETFARHEHALVSLQQETKKTQRLSHPNIVSAYDFDRDGEVAFMTMELLQGQSLDQLLSKNKSGLGEAKALHILRQVTDAIVYAHQQGVVHADLKPANIFITQGGQVKVLDFGIASAIYAESTALDTASIQAFTPAYASINVLCGAAPQQRDDLYALGCIFYMLFAGQHPYGRCKASEADAAGMKAARIEGLRRSQWKALSLLLSFHPPTDITIVGFRDRFFADTTLQPKQIIALSTVLILMLVGGFLLANWFSHREHRAVIALLTGTELESVQRGANELTSFAQDDALLILQGAREPVLENLQRQMSHLDSAEDYRRVSQLFSLVQPLYADSSALQERLQTFSKDKLEYVAQLVDAIEGVIAKRTYDVSTPDFRMLVQDLGLIEPEHELFRKYDFKHLLAKEAGLAVYLGQRALAESIVHQAIFLYPDERSRFQEILQRPQQQVGDSRQYSASASEDRDWLTEYDRAVALAGESNLQTGLDVVSFIQTLQRDNPEMYAVVNASLRRFYSESNVTDKELLALKSQLLPVRVVAAPPQRKDPCRVALANKGSSARSRCQDSLTRNLRGPELVVIKGSRSVPSFAVARTELSVAEFNQYCRLYRACDVRSGGDAPITNITYQQAQSYVDWLSKMSGYRYSIPTQQQWELMARDDSGIRDHNCKVFAGGRWVRGGSLRPVNEGYQNSLGMVNLFGNAAEWVRGDGLLLSAGGHADLELTECSVGALRKGTPEGAPMQGLRVVRALVR